MALDDNIRKWDGEIKGFRTGGPPTVIGHIKDDTIYMDRIGGPPVPIGRIKDGKAYHFAPGGGTAAYMGEIIWREGKEPCPYRK